jgi:hypothetical protein
LTTGADRMLFSAKICIQNKDSVSTSEETFRDSFTVEFGSMVMIDLWCCLAMSMALVSLSSFSQEEEEGLSETIRDIAKHCLPSARFFAVPPSLEELLLFISNLIHNQV